MEVKVPVHTSVSDPDPRSGAFLTTGSDPGSGMGKKSGSGSGSGMNNPDHISESFETIFGLNSLMRIRDEKNSNLGSGINIPDLQHWYTHLAKLR
jgi:hypothetical protein